MKWALIIEHKTKEIYENKETAKQALIKYIKDNFSERSKTAALYYLNMSYNNNPENFGASIGYEVKAISSN